MKTINSVPITHFMESIGKSIDVSGTFAEIEWVWLYLNNKTYFLPHWLCSPVWILKARHIKLVCEMSQYRANTIFCNPVIQVKEANILKGMMKMFVLNIFIKQPSWNIWLALQSWYLYFVAFFICGAIDQFLFVCYIFKTQSQPFQKLPRVSENT